MHCILSEPMKLEQEPMDPADRASLARAVALLEKNSFVTILARMVAHPVNTVVASLPPFVGETIMKASRNAILQCLKIALKPRKPRSLLAMAGNHPALVSGIAGAVGGFAGVAGLAVELPLTTIVMFQSITRIAAAEGEDVSRTEGRLACLEVFALSTDGRGPAALESGYYAARSALAKSTDEAASYVLRRSTSLEAGPAVVSFVSAVAPRFGLLVSQEVAASAIPIIGAATGGSLNVAFVQHFNDIARGHFAVRALERKYGEARVREEFEMIRMADEKPRRLPRGEEPLEDDPK
ncbi:MAG: EcsC family protein [Bryobacteraceae bacterium]